MTDIVTLLKREKVIGIIRADNARLAINAAKYFLDAGFNTVEFTMTIPQAPDCIKEIKSYGDYSVGMGTVRNEETAKTAINAGADFIVTPHLDERVIDTAIEAEIPIIPGVSTPTEIMKALKLGAKMVKAFPSSCFGGINYIKALLGPYPDLNILATGGVRISEITDYLKAGAICVGIGSEVFNTKFLNSGDFEKITEKAMQIQKILAGK